jgi:hypothetical protein
MIMGRLFISNEVVQNDFGMAATSPFVLVAAMPWR